MTDPDPNLISSWLRIEPDGAVRAFCGKVDVGQGIRTSLAQVVAEELRVPLAAVDMVMADTDLVPFDMGTFGSRTSPTMAPQLARAAAAARERLLDWAAEQWGVPREELSAADGAVVHPPSGRSISYGELARGEPLAGAIPEDVPLTPAERWMVAGSAAPKVTARAMVTGVHRFASDVRRPNMLHGKVLRPPAFRATLDAVDTSAAEVMPGVTVVREGAFVGVAAPDERAASDALGKIRARWSVPEQTFSAGLADYLRTHPGPPAPRDRGGATQPFELGSVHAGLAAAAQIVEASYSVAYIAHAPLETRAAVAEWDGDRLTVWTGTQRPFGVREQLAEALAMPVDRIRVIVPDTGAGFGGKHSGECAIEAARLARAAGRAVKLIWTREEEFTWAYFRPAAVIDVKAGVAADGAITAWEMDTYHAGPNAIRPPYDVPNQRVRFHPAEAPLREGAYRALSATANHFARESHVDRLARAAGVDPVELRLRNLRDPRLRAVLEAAATNFGWPTTAVAPSDGERRGVGVACGTEKGSYVATCAEVAVDRAAGALCVVRIVEAFECGAILNPDGLRSQIEGAVVQGLGGALYEAIDFAGGRILNPRFSQYRVPRFTDVPAIEPVLLDRRDLPSAGAGETPIVCVAPAIANAVEDAVGVRLTAIPLAPDGVVG